jgi:hypothetical protein
MKKLIILMLLSFTVWTYNLSHFRNNFYKELWDKCASLYPNNKEQVLTCIEKEEKIRREESQKN